MMSRGHRNTQWPHREFLRVVAAPPLLPLVPIADRRRHPRGGTQDVGTVGVILRRPEHCTDVGRSVRRFQCSNKCEQLPTPVILHLRKREMPCALSLPAGRAVARMPSSMQPHRPASHARARVPAALHSRASAKRSAHPPCARRNHGAVRCTAQVATADLAVGETRVASSGAVEGYVAASNTALEPLARARSF